MKVLRFSGVRLNLSSPHYQLEYNNLLARAVQATDHLFDAAKKEPYMFTDHIKGYPTEAILRAFLGNGELYVPQIDGKAVGYALFREILAHHHAKFEIFLFPEHRKNRTLSDFRDVLEVAAFEPFPKGLDLKKVKASVHPLNNASLRACKNAGFYALCESPLEALFNGVYTSMIFLELYPPVVRQTMKQEVLESNGRREHSISQATAGTNVPAAAELHSGTIDKSTSVDTDTGSINVPGTKHRKLSKRSTTNRSRV